MNLPFWVESSQVSSLRRDCLLSLLASSADHRDIILISINIVMQTYEEATLYAELVNPLIVAVFSALIGVGLSQLGNHLYSSWTHTRKRDSILRVLLNQLRNHRQLLSELEDSLGKNRICSALDPSPVLHFINGNVVALPEDEKLVTALYKHLSNIEMIRRAIDIIGMRSAGFTSVHNEQKEALEQSLKKAIPICQEELNSCLKELPR